VRGERFDAGGLLPAARLEVLDVQVLAAAIAAGGLGPLPEIGEKWPPTARRRAPRDAEIPLTNIRSAPKPALARPPPTRQSVRKGRLS